MCSIQSFLGFLGFLIFIVISIFCMYTATIKYKTYLNVTTLFAFSYLVICTFQVFVTYILGLFNPPHFEYWLIISSFIIATWVIELIVDKKTIKKRINVNNNNIGINKEVNNKNKRKYFELVTILFIVYSTYYSIQQVLNVDIGIMLQDEFQDEFATSTGGSFYTRVILIILATYYLGYQNSIKGFLIGLLCFIPSIIVNTKGILFIPIIAAFIIRLFSNKIKNAGKMVLIVGSIGIFIFYASYMLEYYTYGENPLFDPYRWQYISENLIFYTLSGAQSFSNTIDNDSLEVFTKIDNITLTPFYNLLSKFGLAKNLSSINPVFLNIGTLPTYGTGISNVNTYVGSLYLFNGLIVGMGIHVFWISLITIFKKNAFRKRKPANVILFALFASGLVLDWFEFYFMQTFWFYIIIFIFLFQVISRLRFNHRHLC